MPHPIRTQLRRNETHMKIRSSIPDDLESLVDIWHRSVRTTHFFLKEAEIQSLLAIVREQVLPNLEPWVLTTNEGAAIGFMALSEGVIDALFIAPEHHRQGGGRLFVQHAKNLNRVLLVDVNEQNPEAIKFYMAQDFHIVGRSPVDSYGRPFPLLHMKLGA